MYRAQIHGITHIGLARLVAIRNDSRETYQSFRNVGKFLSDMPPNKSWFLENKITWAPSFWTTTDSDI